MGYISGQRWRRNGTCTHVHAADKLSWPTQPGVCTLFASMAVLDQHGHSQLELCVSSASRSSRPHGVGESCWQQPAMLLAIPSSWSACRASTVFEQSEGGQVSFRLEMSGLQDGWSNTDPFAAIGSTAHGGTTRATRCLEDVRQTYASSIMEISAIREAMRIATLQTTLPIFEVLYVARSWRLQLHRQGVLTDDDAFAMALTKFVNEFTIPWPLRWSTLPVKTMDDPLATLDEWLRWDCPVTVVPRPLGFKQVMVAHLFSGRRRKGDFQDWMSHQF